MRRSTRLAGALAAIGLAAELTLAGAGSARADIVPPPGGWAEIFSPHLNAQGNTLCFDDPNGSTSSGTRLQLWRCHGYASNGAMQRWVFIQPEDNNGNLIYDTNGSPVYEVFNLAASMCLTDPGLAPGTQLTLRPCNRATGGQWWELPSADNTAGPDFGLRSWPVNFTNSCVSASNASDSNGTRLVVEDCDLFDLSQLWELG